MGALDNGLWLCQFALSLVGAVFAFRYYRSIKILWLFLAFRAIADFLTFSLKFGSDPSDLWASWRWANYWQQTIQHVFLAILAMRVIGEATKSDMRTIRLYGALASFVAGLGLIVAHGAAPWTALSLLQIGARADFALAVLVAGCLFMRELDGIVEPMEGPWQMISAGLLMLLTSHAACSELLRHGMMGGLTASRWMAVGQIAGLVVWLLAVRKKTTEVIAEEPMALYWLSRDGDVYRNTEKVSHKFEPERVTMAEETYRGWVN